MAEIKASLKNLRMASRKVRLTANLIKGMSVPQARAQLTFLVKKPAPLILKLLNSAVANGKQNFNVEENNLYIAKILVEAGSTLKRWLPRAMGRATPIRKRTCSIKLILEELVPTAKKVKKTKKPQVLKSEEVLPEVPEIMPESVEEKPVAETKPRSFQSAKGLGDGVRKQKRHFSRQTFGNIKKMFRRKSI